MAAYAASGNELLFKHLTGALTVQVTNSTGHELHVDCITVGSTNYQLCGTRTVNINTLSGLAPTTGTTNLTVSMYFDEVDFAIAAGATREVQLPVLPVGEGHQFHVTVSYRNETDDSAPTCYTLKRQQPAGLATGYSLARNQLGYIPFAAVTTEPADATVQSFATDFFNRDAEGYYKITSANSLQKFGTPEVLTANNRFGNAWNTRNFRLYADIDASGVSYTTVCGFKGTFDGAGHTIRNLAILPANDNAITGTDTYVCGMFSHNLGNTARTITITGLHLENVSMNLTSEVPYMGSIVAYVKTTNIVNTILTLTDCSVNGLTITDAANAAQNRFVGGLVGYTDSLYTFSMTNCSVTDLSYANTVPDSVPARVNIGGLVGRLFQLYSTSRQPTFTQCSYTSTLSSIATVVPENIRFGGMIGYVYHTTAYQTGLPAFYNCSVDISGDPSFASTTYAFVGAFVGCHSRTPSYDVGHYGRDNTSSGSFSVTSAIVNKGNANHKYFAGVEKYYLNSGTNPNLNLVIYEE